MPVDSFIIILRKYCYSFICHHLCFPSGYDSHAWLTQLPETLSRHWEQNVALTCHYSPQRQPWRRCCNRGISCRNHTRSRPCTAKFLNLENVGSFGGIGGIISGTDSKCSLLPPLKRQLSPDLYVFLSTGTSVSLLAITLWK